MKSDANRGEPKHTQDKPKNTGVSFEDEVCAHVKAELNQYRLMLDPNCAKVYRKKGYYSQKRKKDIVFDVVIEAFCKSNQNIPSLIWVWECKDYLNRKVSVEEIEEFYAKLEQIGIGSVKGTVVTRVGFEAGGVEYAKSQRLGLAILKKELVAVTQYQRGITQYERELLASPHGVLLSGDEYTERDRLRLDDIIQIELSNLGLLR
jgi:hypothetical protein